MSEAIDYEKEVRKVYPDATCEKVVRYTGKSLKKLFVCFKNSDLPLCRISDSAINKSKAWQSAYERIKTTTP